MHGFGLGLGTGTASLEANLLQTLRSMREASLYKVFIDLQKAYDALDWEICLNILAAYRVGPRSLWILPIYWGRLTILARAGWYYVPSFKVYRGFTHGDPLSPPLLNVVVDAVIGHWVWWRQRRRARKYLACQYGT